MSRCDRWRITARPFRARTALHARAHELTHRADGCVRPFHPDNPLTNPHRGAHETSSGKGRFAWAQMVSPKTPEYPAKRKPLGLMSDCSLTPHPGASMWVEYLGSEFTLRASTSRLSRNPEKR